MTAVDVGDRIAITYRITSGDPREVADAIRVEQTIEYPLDLAPEWIQEQVVGRIESVADQVVTISYDPGTAQGGLVQLINLLWGNVSLFPDVRIIDLTLPPEYLAGFRGPRYGVPGIRELFSAPERPILATAIKPMGTSSQGLADMGRVLASAGFDVIKDDHGLADQPWSEWADRVRTVGPAIRDAAQESGHRGVYMPSLNVPVDRLLESAHFAKEHGAGALLVLPGVTGFDSMRMLADDDDLGLPIMSHPSFLGSLLVSPHQGIDHGIVLGTLMRLAGADFSVFPNKGGRFSFSAEECLDIKDRCLAPLGDLAPILPAPGGGMSLDRVDEMIDFYGREVALLIGGALHRGDLAANAALVAAAVRSA